ncbi:MAG: hypothetical protein RR189_02620 [Bacilli bacterium]
MLELFGIDFLGNHIISTLRKEKFEQDCLYFNTLPNVKEEYHYILERPYLQFAKTSDNSNYNTSPEEIKKRIMDKNNNGNEMI